MKNLVDKAKGLLRTAELKAASAAAVAAVVMTGVASAVGEDTAADSSAVTSAFQAGFQDMASDALAMIAIIVPIGLSVAGAVWLVKKAMGWFKSIAH